MDELIHRKSWFNRNWKWAVPVGGCMLVIAAFLIFAGSLIWGVTSLMSDSQAHKDAMEAARSNTLVIERIGEPIETNGISGGNIHYSNGFGTAQLSIPIKGPKGEATIRVSGNGEDDSWNYEVMEVFFPDSDEVIDLLREEAPFD
jgi:hypothetical protein